MTVAATADTVESAADYGRPTKLLPIGHLIRISLYWLGLTAIDGAVGLFIQNRLNFGPMAVPDLEVGRTLFLISIPVGVISILVQPTVGSISDYTVSRWGRRKQSRPARCWAGMSRPGRCPGCRTRCCWDCHRRGRSRQPHR